MENFKRITSQQLVTAAACAVMAGGVMLSRHQYVGFALLAIAAVCGLAAYFKSPNR